MVKPVPPREPGKGTRRHRAPTLRDIAREARVSKSTVSRVLNSSPDVSDEARTRTVAAMEQLGYHINHAARSLRTARTSQVGLLVPQINNEVFGEIAERLEELLATEGISLAITSSGWDVNSELRALDALEARGVDVMVIALVDERDRRIAERLQRFGPPLVMLDRQVRGVRGDAVFTDHRIGIGQCIEHLAGLGHTAIAITTGTDNTRPGREQFAAYRDAMARVGLAQREELVVRSDIYTRDSGRHAAETLLANGATAMIACATVAPIAGALEYLGEKRVRIPNDVSFVEYTDSELAQIHAPKLSVILRPVADIGRAAGRLTLSRMANPDLPARVEMVTTQFLDRQSTAGPSRARNT
jgi:LacI family transcriptional regulator